MTTHHYLGPKYKWNCISSPRTYCHGAGRDNFTLRFTFIVTFTFLNFVYSMSP